MNTPVRVISHRDLDYGLSSPPGTGLTPNELLQPPSSVPTVVANSPAGPSTSATQRIPSSSLLPPRRQHDGHNSAAANAFFEQFAPKNYSFKQKAVVAFKLIVAIFACVVFIFGAAGAANEMTGQQGFDEVFLVVGASVLFLFVVPIFNALRRILPALPSVDVLYKCCVALHVSLVITQVAVLQSYMVRYVGVGTLGFLTVDLLLIVTVVFDQWATAWATVYIALTNLKFYLIWRVAFFSVEFLDSVDSLGPNGLLVACLLTLPVIQFFVLTHRLKRGMDLFSAYTTNMVAVFAHTLHVLDVTALFMSGSQRSVAAEYSDSMYLFLFLSITGGMASNIYHVLLFFPSNDDDDDRLHANSKAMNALGEYFGKSNRAIINMRGGLFDDNNGSGGSGGIGIGGGGGGATLVARGGMFGGGGGSRRGRRGGGAGAGGKGGSRTRSGARTVASLGASEGTQDEGLVHYLMWLVFFVDLPFASIRLISWWINGVQLSSLFAKNVMMCVSAIHLLVVHSRGAADHESANQNRPPGYLYASEVRQREF